MFFFFLVVRILALFQQGVEYSLAFNIITGQVSVLAVLFVKHLAMPPLLDALILGVCHVVPLVRSLLPPGDLNLVPLVLQRPSFENIKEIP